MTERSLRRRKDKVVDSSARRCLALLGFSVPLTSLRYPTKTTLEIAAVSCRHGARKRLLCSRKPVFELRTRQMSLAAAGRPFHVEPIPMPFCRRGGPSAGKQAIL
jgi:hypothetical protein